MNGEKKYNRGCDPNLGLWDVPGWKTRKTAKLGAARPHPSGMRGKEKRKKLADEPDPEKKVRHAVC